MKAKMRRERWSDEKRDAAIGDLATKRQEALTKRNAEEHAARRAADRAARGVVHDDPDRAEYERLVQEATAVFPPHCERP